MAAQTDRLLDRAQGPGSAHSTNPPPQFHWEAITLTSWHSLHSSWVCIFPRASWRARQGKRKNNILRVHCGGSGFCDKQLSQEKRIFDVEKYTQPGVFWVQTEIHERIRNYKPKKITSMLHLHARFFRLFLLYHPVRLQWQIISVLPQVTNHSKVTEKPTKTVIQSKGEEVHLNVCGALLDKERRSE